MDAKEVTTPQALSVVTVFLNAAAVLGVQVVGSVAREGKGADLDLVIAVSRAHYDTYVRLVQETAYELESFEWDAYWDFKKERFAAALEVLALSPVMKAWLRLASQDIALDLHLMPQGWQEQIKAVQNDLPHDDPFFVSNLAKDAIAPKWRVVEGTKQAVQLRK